LTYESNARAGAGGAGPQRLPGGRAVDVRDIRSDDLRYLVAIARSGSRQAVARDLGVDDTTVSRRLHALEKVLGVRLLQRSADGWDLTEVGRAVAESAARIEEVVPGTAELVGGTSQHTLRGTIRVAAPDGFGSLFVAPALARLRMDHPELIVELITATRQLNLAQSGFDLAVAVGTTVSSRLVSEQLCEYALGLYASKSYLERHGRPQSIPQLVEHPVVFFVDSLLQVGDLDLHRHLPNISAKFMSTNISAHVSATLAGGGIGLLPAFMAERHADLRRVLASEVDVRVGFSLAARRESLTNPVVQAARRAIHQDVIDRRDELVPPDGAAPGS
jgi:DNA-binding transcriptional LysR family regulator